VSDNPLDSCPTCNKRIFDFDDDGCESNSGQRYCYPHHVPTDCRCFDIGLESDLSNNNPTPHLLTPCPIHNVEDYYND
jgi:hypothetical protein